MTDSENRISSPNLKREYLAPSDAPGDPFELFNTWYTEHKNTCGDDRHYDAACLASTSANGRVSARIVLVRNFNPGVFTYFTNKNSLKARQTAENQQVALCYYWEHLNKQIRIEGVVHEAPAEQSDSYYEQRPSMSRLGAWASDQSSELSSRQQLFSRLEQARNKYSDPGQIPRPPFWGGFIVVPNLFEFWHEGEFRLHHRLVYKKNSDSSWAVSLLYP